MRLGLVWARAFTLLQLLEALECDFKLVGLIEAGGVVLDLDAEKRDDGHGGWAVWRAVWRAVWWGG